MKRPIRGSPRTAWIGIVIAVLLAGYGQKDDLIAQTAKKVAGIKLDQATGEMKTVFVIDNATSAFQPLIGPKEQRVLLSVNFYGAPALTLKEFAYYQQHILVGASLQLAAPLGQYDAEKLLNIGTNRWFIKPELGVSKALGAMTLELAAGVTFYTPNNDFLGGKEKQQDPIYALQGHLVYAFKSSIWPL